MRTLTASTRTGSTGVTGSAGDASAAPAIGTGTSVARLEKTTVASSLGTTRFASDGASVQGIVRKVMADAGTCETRCAREVRLARSPSAVSTVSEDVTASRKRMSRSGRVSTSALSARCTIADITICWLPRREMSLPSPTACRVRASASACVPSMTCAPAGRARFE